MATQPGFCPIARFADFEFHLRTGELRRNGTSLRLQPQPAKVLSLLLSRPGEVITRQDLVREVWGSETFVDFEQGLYFAIRQIRTALEDDAEQPRFLETLPRRGYRFKCPVNTAIPWPNGGRDSDFSKGSLGVGRGLRNLVEEEPPRPSDIRPRILSRKWRIAITVSLFVTGLLSGALTWRSRQMRQPKDAQSIVIAEFTNSTGDTVFDGTLRLGLSVQFEQSLSFKVVSDEEIRRTLQLMGENPGVQLTPKVARDLCQRTNSDLALDGSIAKIGARYDLVLRAVDCSIGEVRASSQVQAGDKNHVIDAVTKLASDMRQRL